MSIEPQMVKYEFEEPQTTFKRGTLFELAEGRIRKFVMTFDEAYAILSSLATSQASYERPACELLWKTAMSVPYSSTIIEVGCEYGRSTALLAMAASERDSRLISIDPFQDAEVAAKFMSNMRQLRLPFIHQMMPTIEAVLPQVVDLVHIDGDHTTEGLTIDCERLLPRVVIGGYAVFHDYGRNSLPTVWPVVDQFTKTPEWEHIGTASTCRVMKRINI